MLKFIYNKRVKALFERDTNRQRTLIARYPPASSDVFVCDTVLDKAVFNSPDSKSNASESKVSKLTDYDSTYETALFKRKCFKPTAFNELGTGKSADNANASESQRLQDTSDVSEPWRYNRKWLGVIFAIWLLLALALLINTIHSF